MPHLFVLKCTQQQGARGVAAHARLQINSIIFYPMNQLPTEDFGTVPQPAETFGNLPHDSESFGNVPKPSEAFRTVRNISERTEKHTLTVREAARLFEQAGVPRTERSIVNWCQLNRQGVSRLDAFFDENEGRYYITPQSVTRAIEEEQAKQPAVAASATSESEIPKHSERGPARESADEDRVRELERQNRDLEIATRAKDYYLERLEKERTQFVEKLVGISRYVGELETQVFQLGGAPRGNNSLPNGSEADGMAQHDVAPQWKKKHLPAREPRAEQQASDAQAERLDS